MHIYLIEIDNYARQIVAQHLQNLGHRVSMFPAPEDLLDALAAESADLIIADLPPSRTRPTSEALRPVHRRYPTIPVLLRASSEVLPVSDAMLCGVYGYLSKPFRAAELDLLLLRLMERQANQSFQDATSGLYHRAGFSALARQQLRAARRTKTEMVLLRADVDGGTLEQTQCALSDLGRVVQRTFRDADIAGRVDGTDCGVLLINASVSQTDIAMRRLERNVAAHNARIGEGQQLQVRVGIAHFDPNRPRSLEELVAETDAGANQKILGKHGSCERGHAKGK